MRFDAYWPDDVQERPAESSELLPDGQHNGEIVYVKEQEKEWARSEHNPRGAVITLKISFGEKYAPVWQDVPAHYRGKISAIATAAGVSPPVKGVDWPIDQLVGCYVMCDTTQGIGKTGREYVRINTWRPGTRPPAVARGAQAKETARLREEFDDGDVPF